MFDPMSVGFGIFLVLFWGVFGWVWTKVVYRATLRAAARTRSFVIDGMLFHVLPDK